MQGVRDFGNALVIALISIGLMVGSLSVSLVEFVPVATTTATSNQLPSPIPLTATATFPATLTPTFSLESPTPSITPTSTMTNTPSGSCAIPFGWNQITVQAGNTLLSIATNYRTTIDELRRANCLFSDNLVAGSTLYVPPVAPNTVVACSPGAANWVRTYLVKSQETFYSISSNYSISVGLLKSVNCRTSDYLQAGEVIWVPNSPTRTPAPSPLPGSTITPLPTDPLTETALPYTITVQPTNTLVPPSNTPLPTSTSAPVVTASPTAFPQ